MSARKGVLGLSILVAIGALLYCGHREQRTGDDSSTAASESPWQFLAGRSGSASIALRGGQRIAGTVYDDDGAPVPNAYVQLASRTSSDVAHATTDARGRFDLGPQLIAKYVIAAEGAQKTATVLAIDLHDRGAPAPDYLALTLHSCDASIHGTIRDTSGGIITKAHVTIALGDVVAGRGAESADDGSYELCVPVSRAHLVVGAAGYATQTADIEAFGRLKHDFAMIPGASISGHVVRESDHAPVEGAVVEIYPGRGQANAPTLRATSGGDGRFLVDGLAPGRHVVSATADHLAMAPPVEVITSADAARENVVCSLVPTHQISGRVVDRDTKQGVGRLSIRFFMRGLRNFDASDTTQPDGSFAVQVIPGQYDAIVPDLAIERAKVQMHDDDIAGVSIEVTTGASITGRVVHAGKPVEGAEVRGNESQTTTDRDGRFTLRSLPAGPVELYAESQRIGAFTRGPSINIQANEQRTGVELVLDLEASISGTVVDQNERPVSGAYLSFSLLRGRDYAGATTDDDGTFTARNISGGGDYIYEVGTTSDRGAYSPLVGRRFPAITVHDGSTHVTGVMIRVRSEQLRIAGRVVDVAGNPAPDVSVRAYPSSRRYRYVQPVNTDANGAFKLDVSRDTYTLHATGTHGEARVENVAAGRTDLVVHLGGLGGLDVTLDGFADDVVVAANYEYRGVRVGNIVQFRDLPTGAVNITARSKAGTADAKVEVMPDTVAKITLREQDYGEIDGTVVDYSGAPARDAECRTDAAYGEDASTDTRGHFHLDHVPAGDTHVRCSGEGFTSRNVHVVSGATVKVDLKFEPEEEPGRTGLEVEEQLSDVVVKSVEPGGPADRAGIRTGDIVVKIDGRPIRYAAYQLGVMLETKPIGTTVTLTLERNDKQVTTNLTIEAAH